MAHPPGGVTPQALAATSATQANPTFGYDADGMMLFGAGRSITPTTFDMAASIASGNATAAFGYDPDHARYKMVASGLNAGTTYYLNDAASGAMEERVVVAGQTTWRDYLMADGRLIGQRQCTGPPPCSSGASMLYFVLDHLGSVTVATDAGGNVLQRLSYDAWGARRNADGSALSCLGGLSPPSGVSRGFTGEETIDALCLVNLNARLYDPALGRMTSADPVVGDATVPQELNRFSYVLNDPLSLTDPSGLCFLGCFWNNAVFRDVLALGVAIVFEQEELLPQLEGFAIGATVPTGLAFVNAGVIGGLSGLISSGGTLKGAALGALEADLFFEAGNVLQDATKSGYLGLGARADTFVAHGLVGGFTSELRGGRFGAGFLSAGVASLAPVPTGQQTSEETAVGTAETAVLGGVGSILGGGKFQNGAITGAFGYLFNYCAHNGCYTTSQERAYLNKGDFAGYYMKACEGNDLNACFFYGVATGENPGPGITLRDALISNGYSFDQAYSLVKTTIPLDLANDDSNLLPQSASQAAFPSAQSIADYHWSEFAKYGLPTSTFGGTPFGKSLVLPHLWCPLCK